MQTTIQYILDGYKAGAPTEAVEAIDAPIAESRPCRSCGGRMRYEAFHRDGSYVAFAVCRKCGQRVEF